MIFDTPEDQLSISSLFQGQVQVTLSKLLSSIPFFSHFQRASPDDEGEDENDDAAADSTLDGDFNRKKSATSRQS